MSSIQNQRNIFHQEYQEIKEKLDKYEIWKKAVEFHENYVYCGEHWEDADDSGFQAIYHYISKRRLGSRSTDELSITDYDIEVWVDDDIWIYCGHPQIDKLNYNEYSDEIVQNLKMRANEILVDLMIMNVER